jgi:hypothetical protein
LDTNLTTLELTFPRDLDHQTATRLFTALSGLYGPVRKVGRMTGRDTIVFEVLSTPERLRYFLSVRPSLAKTVESHLTGVIRSIGIEQSTVDVKRDWQHVFELGRHSNDGDEPRTFDPKMVEVLLRSTRNLRANEAVMIQFVMTPIGNIVGDQDGGFWAVGRLAAAGHELGARDPIKSVLSAYRSLQVFAARRLPPYLEPGRAVVERRAPVNKWPGTYRPEELAVMCGLPIGGPQVPGIVMGRRKLPPDMAIPREGIVLGESNHHGAQRPIALSPLDLTKHMHIMGQIGVGKSTMIENQILQAMEQGHGLIFIDPTGDSFNNVLDRVPKSRMSDVILLDLTDASAPVGFNVLEGDPYMVTNQVIAVFDRLYGMQHMARTMDVLRSTVLTLALKKYTLLDIPAVLAATTSGERLREHLVKGLIDPALQDFWRQYEAMPAKMKTEAIYPVITRLRPFETWPSLRGSLGQAKSGFSFEKVLSDNKIVLVNLSKGQIGEEESKLFGSLLVSKFWIAAQRRKKGQRKPYFLFIDEFQNYVNLPVSFGTVLDEARKYGICFVKVVAKRPPVAAVLPGAGQLSHLRLDADALLVGFADGAVNLAPESVPAPWCGEVVVLTRGKGGARIVGAGKVDNIFAFPHIPGQAVDIERRDSPGPATGDIGEQAEVIFTRLAAVIRAQVVVNVDALDPSALPDCGQQIIHGQARL